MLRERSVGCGGLVRARALAVAFAGDLVRELGRAFAGDRELGDRELGDRELGDRELAVVLVAGDVAALARVRCAGLDGEAAGAGLAR